MLHVISRSVDHIWIGAGTNTKVIFIIIKIRKVWAKDFLWWTSCHVEQTSQSRIMLGAQARERLEKGSLGHGMGVCGPLVHPRGWKCLTWTSCWGDGSVGWVIERTNSSELIPGSSLLWLLYTFLFCFCTKLLFKLLCHLFHPGVSKPLTSQI